MIDVFCENEHGYFPYKTVNSFGGIMVDYHTKNGYTKRVAFSLGQINKKRSAQRPRFGKGTKPDYYCLLDNLIANGRKKQYSLDLSQWAPNDWDGKAWVIIGTDRASSGRQLGLEIIDFSEKSLKKNVIKNLDATAFDITIPSKNAPKTIDGNISYNEWKNAINIKDLFALATMEDCPEKTDIKLSMDNKYFYIGMTIYETTRNFVTFNKHPFIWKNDAIDISFGLPNGIQHQIIIDALGQIFQSDTLNGKTTGIKQNQWTIKAKTKITQKQCNFEIAIKLEDLLTENGKIKFNLTRYRATDKKSVEIYTISPISKYSLMEPALFNNLILKK